jgi:hypothetical protein
MQMKNTIKGILAAIPLAVGLAGSAEAAISDAITADSANGPSVTPGVIDSLLNQYSGLTPGDPDHQNPVTHIVPPSQQISTFTGSAGAMVTYYTTLGVDRSSPNEPLVPSGVIGSSLSMSLGSSPTNGNDGSDPGAAAAPAVAALTVIHAVQDSLVGSVANGITPTSSSGSNSAPVSPASEQTPPTDSGTPLTTTPIPPSATLICSGLAALVSLRLRKRNLGTIE